MNNEIDRVDKLSDPDKDISNFSRGNFYWPINQLDGDLNRTKLTQPDLLVY